jgi:coupling of ubiquitin conjugation to ER degradation protein 1
MFFNTPSGSMTGGSEGSQPVKKEIDLITRYNLQSRVGSVKGKEKETEEQRVDEGMKKGWEGVKEERQRMLQRRWDEMILKARRKMVEKDEMGQS